MKVALSTHLFVFYTLNKDILSMIREYGFTNIEIWGMRPHFDYYDNQYLNHIKKSMDEFRLKVCSFHAPMYRFVGDAQQGLWLFLSDINEEKRRSAVEETKKLMEVAGLFEPINFVIHPDLSVNNFELTLKNLRISLEELEPAARKAGIKLALETGIRSSNLSSSIVNLVNELDPETFGVCVDVGHANVGENSLTALEVAMERLLEVHVSDNNGDGDAHLVPGEGNIKWAEVVGKLKACNFEGNFVFEIMDPVRDNTRDIREFAPILEKLRSFTKDYKI